MRSGLKGLLGLTVVASAALVWLDKDGPSSAMPAIRTRPDRAFAGQSDGSTAQGRAAAAKSTATWTAAAGTESRSQHRQAAALPEALEPLDIEPAQRDPFSPSQPSLPQKQPALLAKADAGPPPAPPTVPPLAWRYWGSLKSPIGQRMLMLARGDQVLQVQPGTRLDDGYVVQSVSEDSLLLMYEPTGLVVELPLPATRADGPASKLE